MTKKSVSSVVQFVFRRLFALLPCFLILMGLRVSRDITALKTKAKLIKTRDNDLHI